MTQIAKLDINTPMCDFTTGEPIANLSQSLAIDLGIKNNGIAFNEKDVQEHRKEIPDLTIADVLNSCFDVVPLATKTEFATYNNILIDIRNARRQDIDHIEVDKKDIELLKTIFEKGLVNKPELNRKGGFIIEVLEQAIVGIVGKNASPPQST